MGLKVGLIGIGAEVVRGIFQASFLQVAVPPYNDAGPEDTLQL